MSNRDILNNIMQRQHFMLLPCMTNWRVVMSKKESSALRHTREGAR